MCIIFICTSHLTMTIDDKVSAFDAKWALDDVSGFGAGMPNSASSYHHQRHHTIWKKNFFILKALKKLLIQETPRYLGKLVSYGFIWVHLVLQIHWAISIPIVLGSLFALLHLCGRQAGAFTSPQLRPKDPASSFRLEAEAGLQPGDSIVPTVTYFSHFFKHF